MDAKEYLVSVPDFGNIKVPFSDDGFVHVSVYAEPNFSFRYILLSLALFKLAQRRRRRRIVPEDYSRATRLCK